MKLSSDVSQSLSNNIFVANLIVGIEIDVWTPKQYYLQAWSWQGLDLIRFRIFKFTENVDAWCISPCFVRDPFQVLHNYCIVI
jgi:hypothetical protein